MQKKYECTFHILKNKIKNNPLSLKNKTKTKKKEIKNPEYVKYVTTQKYNIRVKKGL